MKKLLMIGIVLYSSILSAAIQYWKDTTTGIEWSYEVINNEVAITKSSVYSSAISGFSGEELDIPSKIAGYPVTQIGGIYKCTTLKKVNIPESVRVIRQAAFYFCTALTEVNIPAGVISIGDNAFDGCAALTNITIPEGVTSIGSSAFRNTALEEIHLPDTLQTIGTGAFSGTRITKVIIPASCSSSSVGAFSSLGLLEITAHLPTAASTLEKFTLATGARTYNMVTFNDYSQLKSIRFPKSIYSLYGDNGFAGCSSLQAIYFDGKPPIFQDAVLREYNNDPNSYYSESYISGDFTGKIVYAPKYTELWLESIEDGFWTGFTVENEGTLVKLNVTGGGNVSGDVEYLKGGSTTLTATPAEGYVFAGWSGDKLSQETTLTIDTTEPLVKLTALFIPKTLIQVIVKESVDSEVESGTIASAADIEELVKKEVQKQAEPIKAAGVQEAIKNGAVEAKEN